VALSLDEIRRRLEAFLERETQSRVAVSELRPLAGGASREALALDVSVESGPSSGSHACVLRLDQGGKIFASALGRVAEGRLLRLVRAAGVRVPSVWWVSDDPQVLGRDFLVLERVDGETIGRRIVSRPELEGARAVLPRQLGEELARIHAVDPAPLEFLARPRTGESPAQTLLALVRGELDRIEEPHPALEVGWRWLSRRAPACSATVLVHGDYRLGNVVVGPEGLRYVLDWEFAWVGDPHEDLAWPFVRDWRFGNDAHAFAGLSDGREFLDAYEAASGRSVDREALRFWEILGNFRWALGCLTQARRHLSGAELSVELASLGRRAAEMEIEMMDLIAAGGG
jgi:aminoglycoside phosphotransferase (APT) family kinase protein